MTVAFFPEPSPNPDDAFWWDGLRQGTVLLPRCTACSQTWMPPMSHCPYCGVPEPEAIATSGQGSVYSWVTTHRAFDPAFDEDVPYSVLVIDLDEGARMHGRLLDPVTPRAGQRVRARIYERGGWPLVGFSIEEPTESGACG